MYEIFTVQSHRFAVEDDVLFIVYVGVFEIAHTEQMIATAERIFQKHHRVFLLSDVTRSAALPAESRKRFVQWYSQDGFSALANFGADLTTRTVGTLALNAVRVLHRKHIPFTFVKTESEARSFIAAQRRILAS